MQLPTRILPSLSPVPGLAQRALAPLLLSSLLGLALHGLLHLQGYDHESPREARRMEVRERRVLAALGFPDPYAD